MKSVIVPLVVGVIVSVVLAFFLHANQFLGPIIGAIIGATIAVANTNYQKYTETKSLRSSLIAEISQLVKLIKREKKQFEKSGEENVVFSASEDYFTAYTQNAGKIGMLGPNQAQSVIIAYMETKRLFDAVKLYSTLSKELTERRELIQKMNPGHEKMSEEKLLMGRSAALKDFRDEIKNVVLKDSICLLNKAKNHIETGNCTDTQTDT